MADHSPLQGAAIARSAQAAQVARWYALSLTTGMATLCANGHDATTVAAEADEQYPASAPHVATQLAVVVVENFNGNDGDNRRQPQGTTSGGSPDYSPSSHLSSTPTAAPTECRAHECRRVRTEMQAEIDRLRAAVPAGEAVAWRYRDDALFGDTEWRYLDLPPLRQYAETQPLYTHPAVDALGAVRDAITETVLKYADNNKIPPGLFRDEMFAAVTAAIQHRGDSRGGEG